MRITKYSQSTFVVENQEGMRLLIDPGQYNYVDGFTPPGFGDVHMLAVTHEHADHHDVEAEHEILERNRPFVFTNHEIAQEEACADYIVKDVGDVITEYGFKITLINADHFAKGKQVVNFGMLIEADGHSFYHTSDTRFMETGMYDYELVKNPTALTVPISNRGVVMGPDDAIVFTSQVQPKFVIPGHYDSPKDAVRVNADDFKERFDVLSNRIDALHNVEVKILDFGESLDIGGK